MTSTFLVKVLSKSWNWYLIHKTDIWAVKLWDWHSIPEFQILSNDWHLTFGNAFWLIWRALQVIESELDFSLEASVSLECLFGSLTGLVILKCIFDWLTAFFNYIWYNHIVWNFLILTSDVWAMKLISDLWYFN